MRFTVPLCRWLSRAAHHVQRAAARPSVARRRRMQRVSPRERNLTASAPGLRLPMRRGWLVRELGWEAAAHMSHLQVLLDDPAMQVVITQFPVAMRIIRPLARMLGVPVAMIPELVDPPVVAAAGARRARPQWLQAADDRVPAGPGLDCPGVEKSA